MLKLSKRLKHIASYIPYGSRFADIGSDHAYLCSYVCRQDKSTYAIAGEVREGPFQAAKKTIYKYGLEAKIDVRLGDGLEVINKSDQIDTIIIAGMGGRLITDILKKDRERLQHIGRVIVQPNTNPELVRKLFIEEGFSLINEEMIEENHHIYEILVASKNASNIYDPSIPLEKQIYFGPLLMDERSPIFKKKWLREYRHTIHIINQFKKSKNQNQRDISIHEKHKIWMEEVLK